MLPLVYNFPSGWPSAFVSCGLFIHALQLNSMEVGALVDWVENITKEVVKNSIGGEQSGAMPTILLIVNFCYYNNLIPIIVEYLKGDDTVPPYT